MTTPPNESNASRAKFEAAMRADGFESDHYFVQLSEEFRGDYYNDDTQMRWEGWQLAIASLSLAEPVAYRYRVKGQSWRTWFYAQEAPMPTNAHMFEIEPLYAHPPALADDAKFEELLNALCVEILEGVMETTCGKPIKARTALRAYFKQVSRPPVLPLTDDEIRDMWATAGVTGPVSFYRAIERAHSIGPSTSEGE